MKTGNRAPAIRTWLRILLLIAGTVCVGLGIVGVFVPVLPTTPFLLLAAACYARSSPRFHSWLLNNKWFGSYIRNYLEKKGITLRAKIITLSLLWITIGVTIAFAVETLALKLILGIIAIGVSIHILSLRTLK
jgi:uncharacterized membrane protein YbaN (DUF454 family)